MHIFGGFPAKPLLGSLSENTIRAYQSDIKIFRYWCEDRGFEPIPATPNVVANFLAAQASNQEQPVKAVTIIRRACAIRYLHQLAEIDPLPTDALLVRKTLRGIIRKKLMSPNQKKPIDAELIKMMADLTPATLLGLRDRALLLVGFAGAFRRSELVAIKVDDVDMQDKGMSITIRKSKTDQEGRGRKKPILRGESHCPVAALQAWLIAADITEGYVFKAVNKNGTALLPRIKDDEHQDTPDLNDRIVARVVKKYASLLGLESADYSGHSLRRGFITSSLLAGASVAKTMEVSHHKDPKSTLGYFEDIKQFEGHAGKGLL